MTLLLRPPTRIVLWAFGLGLSGLWASPAAAQPAPGSMWTLPGPPPPAALPPPPEPPPPPPDPRDGLAWQIDASLQGSIYNVQPNMPNAPLGSFAPAPSSSGNSASGNLELTRFLPRILDDGTPRSLQPFLQRASALYAEIGGGGFVTRTPGLQDRTDSNLGLSLGMDVYVTRFLALTAGVGYGYDVLHDAGVDQTSNGFSAHGGLGIRVGDVRFDASYAFSASESGGTFAPLRWGTFEVSGFIVIARSFVLLPRGFGLQGGGGGGLDLAYYPTRDFGFRLGAFGERGELYSTPSLVDNRYGGDALVSYWVSRNVYLALIYNLTIDAIPGQFLGAGEITGDNQTTHSLTAAAAFRL